MKISRRDFIKIAAVAGASVALPLSLPRPRTVIDKGGVKFAAAASEPSKSKVVVSSCLICGQRCPFKIYVRKVGDEEVIEKIVYASDPSHDEFFAICGRPQTIFELRYLPERIPRPLKRVGPRGSGQFVEITWEEALDIIAKKIKELMDKGEVHRIVAVSHQGYEGSHVRDFFKNVIGTPNATQHCDTCHTGMDIGHKFIFGSPKGPSAFQPDYKNAKMIIVMGRNPVGGIVASAWTKMFTEGRANKAKLVVFDVRKSRLTAIADEYYIIPPATDLAISLAILNVILTEKLYNKDYLIKWTNAPMLFYADTLEPVKLADNPLMEGKKTYLVYDEATGEFKLKTEAKQPALEYEGTYNGRPVKTALLLLKDHVKDYTPEWAEKITGVPANTIRRIARELAEAAPKAFIDHGYKGARYYNEGMLKRVNMLINVLIGSVGSVGGVAYPAGKPKIKHPFDIIGIEKTKPTGLSIPDYWAQNGIENIIGKCWSQLLVKTIMTGKPYPIGLLFIHLENLVAHTVSGRKFLEALKDEKRVELIVVADTTFNETVMYADIVLPIPLFFEATTWSLQTAKKSYVSLVTTGIKAVDPPSGIDARPTWWILVELAKRLGKLPPNVEVDPLEVQRKQAEALGINFDELLEKGYVMLWTKPKYHPWGGEPLSTVTGELEIVNVALLEKYRGFVGKESPLNPFPIWIRPLWMRKGQLAPDEFIPVEYQDPLTSINMLIRFAKLSIDALEYKNLYGVLIHPSRAEKLGLRTGDLVRIKGAGGEIIAKVIVSEDVHPYIIAAPHATAIDEMVIPRTARIKTREGREITVKLFSKGGGYGINNNLLADPDEAVVPEEGYRAAQHDFVVRIEKITG
ncbi:molybdopterin-dependent oxidoreductase [Hyperthermus butylicus]|uniref:Anaerobic dehydrogenase, BisC n=1 Tax=Hyperthermus butylicus (strain DSM 5456 / JCM 9403 / PLM1-5) TaxID=415426 RepID=A2BJT3_HYPBU|nr:molybdopterin-dependent oxidoreductase [Hyperthermus butylicus]ABM80244.1 Anaerobic dehydrogenase, BisC [Hyperthermus butylicus DSM 5456]